MLEIPPTRLMCTASVIVLLLGAPLALSLGRIAIEELGRRWSQPVEASRSEEPARHRLPPARTCAPSLDALPS